MFCEDSQVKPYREDVAGVGLDVNGKGEFGVSVLDAVEFGVLDFFPEGVEGHEGHIDGESPGSKTMGVVFSGFPDFLRNKVHIYVLIGIYS